ncbi:MAG: tRNA (guanosine(37)-N1)-methyltransferase TrmD [Candidatus Latescibacteria bacterium]|nr:tRNA (guanosine(37)-N1)-methyltransferase TrmD [Candidatus Latescibacterota bacterium]MCK5526741.1 tRNA (guanosine(37)-N1)-methyltransferase TrmD [Candidatus Latescibacterota bacterium]
MRIDIITLFPDMFRGPFGEGLMQRARERELITIRLHDLRAFSEDKHGKVDDFPYGGGAGMVLKPEPVARALEAVRRPEARIILLTPQGAPLTQKRVNALSLEQHLILLCGRYKGIDERIRRRFAPDEISIGDYVLMGGELPAMVLTESVVRVIPGVLGDSESALEDSFQHGLLDCPWYTRPEEFEGMRVPEVLCSGDHAKIKAWREKESTRRTRQRRPDLWEQFLVEKEKET